MTRLDASIHVDSDASFQIDGDSTLPIDSDAGGNNVIINNIKKRTTDNKALIDELSQLREEQRARQRDLNRLDMQIQGVALKKKRLESDLD